MSLTLVFLAIFALGPLVFAALMCGTPSASNLRRIALLGLVSILAGLVIRYGMAQHWGRNGDLALLAIALIWLAWIVMLGLGAQILRRRNPGGPMRRWTGVIGALGTTVPWFGLAAARLLSG